MDLLVSSLEMFPSVEVPGVPWMMYCQGALCNAMYNKVKSCRPKRGNELPVGTPTTLERVAVYKFLGEDGTPTKHSINTDNKVGTAHNSDWPLANARRPLSNDRSFLFLVGTR